MKPITVPAGSVYTLSGASANLVAGDFFCSLPSDTTGVTVTKATAAAVIAAGGVAGCVKAAFTAGATNVEGFSQGIIGNNATGLGAGTASDVILSTTGRALRNVRPAGGAKKETQLGTCDTAGNLTLHLQSNVSMSPKRIFNVCDYGAVGDGQYDIGTGTDNYAAIMACLTAIKASRYNFLHGGATMYFPQGMYRIYQQIPITFPVSIEGDGVGTVFPSTVIFGNDASDNEVGLFWLQTQGEAADGLVGSAGVSISRIGLAQSHPALQWGINANFRPGARATTARRTIPSPQGGGYRDVIWRCSVEGVIGKTEPLWPTDMTPARVYATGRVAINPDIVGAASPYEYTATVGGTSSGVPQGGRVANITVWAAGQAVTGHNPARGPGDYRRPTDAGWTGYYYEAQNTGLTAGAEPTWPTTLDGTVVDDGGVLWKLVSIKGENGQSIEKAQLLGRTVGQTTIDGTVTWTLTAKMPTVTDGDATWIPKFPTHGIVNHVASEVDDVWLGDINGDAMHYIASTGLATPTNINGSSARRIRMSTIAGHGLYLAGGDSNACYFEAFNITLTGGYGIYDASFLGNTHIGHQVDAGGRGAYSSAGPVEPSIWLGCYSEGGQPPSRILAPAIVLGGFHGAGFTTDSTARIISGKEQGFTVRVERSQELWGYQNDLPFPHRVWALGEVCFENTPNTGAIYAHRVSAITTGISGSEQPTWNHTIGGNTLDSGVTWTNIGAQSMQAQLGDLAHDPHLWLSYQASTMKYAWKWVYREDPSFGNWPGQGWLAFTETSSDANTAIAVSTSQATEGPGNFALVGHHIYWRRGSSLSDATTLPFTEAERDAKTTTDATVDAVVHTYTPPDGAVVTVAYDVLALQTAGDGAPRAAVYHLRGSWRRAGSELKTIADVTSVAGNHNEGQTACTLGTSGAALRVLVTVTGAASQTWKWRIIRESIEALT